MAHLVQCKNTDTCGATVTINEHDVDIHQAIDAAGCTCCTEDHHHGQAANETGTACRPLRITLLAGSADVGLVFPELSFRELLAWLLSMLRDPSVAQEARQAFRELPAELRNVLEGGL